jgi:hypothetical protein
LSLDSRAAQWGAGARREPRSNFCRDRATAPLRADWRRGLSSLAGINEDRRRRAAKLMQNCGEASSPVCRISHVEIASDALENSKPNSRDQGMT